MTIDLGDINYLAMLVGIVVYVAAGGLWYSPVMFATPWMKELGTNQEEIQQRGGRISALLTAIVGAVVAVFVLAILVEAAHVSNLVDGLYVGLLAGIGFVLSTFVIQRGPGRVRGQVAAADADQCGPSSAVPGRGRHFPGDMAMKESSSTSAT